VTGPAQFSFVKLVVDDLDKMISFYREVFDLRVAQRLHVESDGKPIEEVIFESGDGARLILVKWLDRPAPAVGELVLGARSSEIETLFARAQAAGATILRPLGASEHAGGMRIGIFEDPEGHATEVVESAPVITA